MSVPRLRLRVSAAAESSLRAGHPWLFAESIQEQNRAGELGELAVVYDRRDRFLAFGLYDPDSPIRLRVLHTGKPQTVERAWWSGRLAQALDRRRGLFDDQTTGFRWVNGESDGWPGLVIDQYDQTVVLKLYTAAWLPRLEEIASVVGSAGIFAGEWRRSEGNNDSPAEMPALPTGTSHAALISTGLQPGGDRREAAGAASAASTGCEKPLKRLSPTLPRCTGLKPGANENGVGEYKICAPVERLVLRLSRNIQRIAQDRFGKRDGEVLLGAPLSGPVVFLESGLRFEADVLQGQKTGFFLDQRENRRRVETLAGGRSVLNAFSFSGGFSLYAARGGARSVTDLDLSAHALAGAQRNFALNQTVPAVAACGHETVQAEAFDWLSANPKRQFDLVVLDPPSLAKRETERAGALRAYAHLAALGVEHLSPEGILVACSCSAHVTAEEFFTAVRAAATRSRRPFTELQTTHHAPDHPATFKEAQYLKGIYLTKGTLRPGQPRETVAFIDIFRQA